MRFPFFKQLDGMDCGSTCLKMIAQYYGKVYNAQSLRAKCGISRSGVSLLGISEAAETIGFRTLPATTTLAKLAKEQAVPFIAHWRQKHYVVVYKIKQTKARFPAYKIYVADPAIGKICYKEKEFERYWVSTKQDNENKGVALLIEPTTAFYDSEGEKKQRKNFAYLLKYLKPHKVFIKQVLLALMVSSVLQLIFPFLTQSLIDIGVNTQNLNFVHLILLAQLVLFIARMLSDFIRGWLILHISTRINIALLSDFLIKLLKLPLSFFDTKLIGDLMQRIGDHKRIEQFLSYDAPNILFSMFNLVIFGLVLAYYNDVIFLTFLIGSLGYLTWILLFMKKRRAVENLSFQQSAENQSKLLQLIHGIQDIKLNNCEKQKRWEWERIQVQLFNTKVKNLQLSQYQQLGSVFFNEGKNIIITIIAATLVINGKITLGEMLAIQYILGQLNGPLAQMISFIQRTQDAIISFERLGEIHNKPDEEDNKESKLDTLPPNKEIQISDLSFFYEGANGSNVLDKVKLTIPQNKITAIVGTSGSGKTTLMKLLLGFYKPTKGSIKIDNISLENYKQQVWRSHCGVVLQDGYIFSDTIARNIAVGDEYVDKRKLLEAALTANIQVFIDELPLGFNTKIGQEGIGLSQGQKQRILIARAIYKNPEYIFLDEATNALDANNEKVIMDNLNAFFKGRTVVVIAHRLSTVKNADQIIVLNKGKIVEQGNHEKLTQIKGAYYELVKNQLELGG